MTADEIWRAFCAAHITHVVGLPDTQSDPIFARQLGPGPTVVTVCREGEALGIAAGLWAGGRRPVVLCQCTGFLEAGDAVRSFHLDLELPLDMVIGWRGRSGKPNAGHPDTVTELLLPTLAAWQVPYDIVEGPAAERQLVDALVRHVDRQRGVRALLLPQ